MTQATAYDAVVIGSGPNGLAAAITLARAGCSVVVFEAEETIGGGARSAELTLPGFTHDLCSAVHPLAVGSPFFRELPLAEHGLEWIEPPLALAHPFDDGTAAILARSVPVTAAALGEDAEAYQKLMMPLVEHWAELAEDVLAPIHWPRHPLTLARFGLHAIWSAQGLAKQTFATEQARALFAGLAAHSMLPLDQLPTAAFGLILGITGHALGWPLPRGGAQRIADALASYLRSLGGEIVTATRINSLDDLPSARAILADITPRQLLQLAGERLPEAYRQQLQRYQYGLAAYKVDWALAGPVPWRAADCARAGTVHLGGSLPELAAAEAAAWRGQAADQPFVLLTQPSLFDDSRAPAGEQTVWAYCHVPNSSTIEMVDRIEAQIERFAPGFRALIQARSVRSPAALEQHNANLVGGDINGGVQDWRQLFFRPTRQLYSTPVKGLYLCSAATPPGGGVHGMCGYHAAQRALREVL